MALLVFVAAALGVWMSFSSSQVKSTKLPTEASLTTTLPIELMRKSNKELPDGTVPEPF
jgi:hypothetical protein